MVYFIEFVPLTPERLFIGLVSEEKKLFSVPGD